LVIFPETARHPINNEEIMGTDFKKFQVKWEDEDTDFEGESSTKKRPEPEVEEDFSTLLDKYDVDNTQFRTGEKVSGIITQFSDDSDEVLVELTNVLTGFIEKHQLVDEHGTPKYKVGDRIETYVVSKSEGAYQLSMTMERSKQAMQDLQIAFNGQIPVTGKVTGENKGGFEVQIFGKTAFCPVSQIDTSFVENKAAYIGRELEFLIEKIEDRGKNIVVSRSKLLKIAAEKRMQELKASLKPDNIYEGIVKDIRDYGAFVDLGGIDGFLHVSELSYSRIAQIRDFLTVGEKVRVKILAIEEKEGKTRISLSMKAVDQDPWLTVANEFNVSSYYEGRVTRLTKFGAFVELRPGVEGLIHLSEMSWTRRILKAEEVVKEGDLVKIRILDMNPTEKKISLSLKEIEADPWHDAASRLPKGKELTGKVERLKGYGAIVEIEPGMTGLIPMGTLKKAYGESYKRKASPPHEIKVIVAQVDAGEKKILLSLPEAQSDENDTSYQEYLGDSAKKAEEQSHVPSSGKMGSFGALLEKQLKNTKK
jgi:small subunit ribosomal protein S1